LIRAGVKQRVAAIVGSHLERTVYVSVASVLFLLVCAAWRPVPGVVWSASPPWSVGLIGLQLAGVALTVRAASGIDLLELAGVRQAWGEGPRGPARLTTTGAYRFVRHPIYFGWLLMVWPAPEMTGTRLVFAAASTLYLIVAIPFEERDLRRALGADYAAYQRRVRWRLLPFVF
jgi:protein-S-isoprenylcysteine O-methyltransferase Ste14